MYVKLVSAFSLWVLEPRLFISFKYYSHSFFVFFSWNLESFVAFIIYSGYTYLAILCSANPLNLYVWGFFFLFLLYFKQDFFTANWGIVTQYGKWNDSKVIMSDLQVISNICTTFLGSTSPSFLLCANEITLEAMDQAWKPYDTTTNWSESP